MQYRNRYIICLQVSSDKGHQKKKELNNVNKESNRRVTEEPDDCGRSVVPVSCNEGCQVDDSACSEPPKKQHRFDEESGKHGVLSKSSVPCQLSDAINERKTVKSEVVTVECDPNALLTFRSDVDHALDLLSLARNEGAAIRSESAGGDVESELCLQTYVGKNVSKVSTSAFWERERPGTKSLAPGNGETQVKMPAFCENGVQVSGNNGSEINQVAYSKDNVSGVNPPSCSGMSRSHPNSHVCGESNGSGVNPSVYPGNSGLGIHSSAFSGSTEINPASYPVYNAPGCTSSVCSGNNVHGINYLTTFSGSDKAELSLSYSGNNGMGINSLTYSGNSRTMMPPTYYGNDGSGITPQTYSGNGPRENSLVYSGNNGSGISLHSYPGNNGSGTNTLTYSSNNPTINSLSYCGNKRSVVHSQPYPTSSRGVLNSQSYSVNSGPGISSSSYSGNSGTGINSLTYSGNSGSGLNSADYSGNGGSGVNHMHFGGSSSFSESEVAQQYEILRSYCGNSESRIDST
jgi:hypothetical protein